LLHTRDEAIEEGLRAEISIVVLEMLLAGRHELDGNELVAISR
jgi:hypothetical protein